MTPVAGTERLSPTARRLVEDNLSLVDHITRRVTASYPRHVDREELARAGVLGLVEAAIRFDPQRGHFTAYAGRRIEGAIVDELRRRSWAPRSVQTRARSLARVEDVLTQQLGQPPSEAHLARAAGLTVAELADHRARSARSHLDTLDRPAGDGSDRPVSEVVADPHARPTEEQVEEDELRAYLRAAVANLPERHRLVIIGYFLEGRSTEELARLLGVSQSRVSQLKEYALELMRWGIGSQYGDEPSASGGPRSQRTRAAYAALVAAHADGRTAIGRARPHRSGRSDGHPHAISA